MKQRSNPRAAQIIHVNDEELFTKYLVKLILYNNVITINKK